MAQDRIEVTIAGVDKFSQAFTRAEGQIIALNQAFALAEKAVRLVQIAWTSFEDNVLQTTDSFRKSELQLTQLTGSNEKAQQSMAFLLQTAKDTPFTLRVLNDAYVKLTVGGVADTEQGIVALTNAVAAFGGTSEHIKRAAVAIQQMGGKGVISMEELRQQLGEAIPTASKVMARELGMTLPDMFKLIETGGLESKRGLDALFAGLEKDYTGAAKKMMDTWSGATSNMSDAWDQLMRAIGESGVYDAAVDAVQTLTAFISELTDKIQINAGSVRGNLESVEASIAKLQGRILSMEGNAGLFGISDENKLLIKDLKEKVIELHKERERLIQQDMVKFLIKEEVQLAQVAKVVEEVTKAFETATKGIDEYQWILTGATSAMDEFERAQEGMRDGFVEIKTIVDETVTSLMEMEKQIISAMAEMDKGIEMPTGDGGGDIGAQVAGAVAGQMTGAGAAMAGFQAGGPMGAAVAFGMDLLMQNPAIRDAMGELNAALAELIAPIAEAIAPAIKIIAPWLRAMVPVMEIAGNIIAYWVGKLIPIIEFLTVGLTEAVSVFEHYSAVMEKIFGEAGNMADVKDALIDMTQAFIPLRDDLVRLKTNIEKLTDKFQAFADGIVYLTTAIVNLPQNIIDSLKEGIDPSKGGSVTIGGQKIASWHDGGLITNSSPGSSPGLANDERLTVLQVGERVQTAEQQATGGGITFNIQGGMVDDTTINQIVRRVEERLGLGRMKLV